MDCSCLCNARVPTIANHKLQILSSSKFSCPLCPKIRASSYSPPPSPSTSLLKVKCTHRTAPDEEPCISTASSFSVLGVSPGCSSADLKAAFRAKVKEFHPNVRKRRGDSDMMIRRVIQAYELLSNLRHSEIIEREWLDPFEVPECEAYDVFVNEVLCAGTGCPYSCVKRAPHAFTFVSSTGTARARCQGHGEDYQVQLAVGQCPRSCIHYVTFTENYSGGAASQYIECALRYFSRGRLALFTYC